MICILCDSDLLSFNEEFLCDECKKKKSDAAAREKIENDLFTEDEWDDILAQRAQNLKKHVRKLPEIKSPIVCPYNDCTMYISASKFLVHFKIEHPEVKKFIGHLNKRFHVSVEPLEIHFNKVAIRYCFTIKHYINGNEKVYTTFALMVTRININSMDDNRNKLDIGSEQKHDKLLVWVATTTLITYFNYAVYIPSTSTRFHLRYVNTVKTMDDMDPLNTYLNDDCVTLNHYQYMKLSNEGKIPINMIVTISDSDDEDD